MRLVPVAASKESPQQSPHRQLRAVSKKDVCLAWVSKRFGEQEFRIDLFVRITGEECSRNTHGSHCDLPSPESVRTCISMQHVRSIPFHCSTRSLPPFPDISMHLHSYILSWRCTYSRRCSQDAVKLLHQVDKIRSYLRFSKYHSSLGLGFHLLSTVGTASYHGIPLTRPTLSTKLNAYSYRVFLYN